MDQPRPRRSQADGPHLSLNGGACFIYIIFKISRFSRAMMRFSRREM
jgi:hypothetical protein